ncbi:hypothetical protein [uncultured Aquimarina sp.]|uniref:hypothetical protein n=1 Tax=uncultured Aquimarina sp. TaxID=575652 RepID=UPI002625797D|nr:hypothetical protein [uncultured Aquimarina sp.]
MRIFTFLVVLMICSSNMAQDQLEVHTETVELTKEQKKEEKKKKEAEDKRFIELAEKRAVLLQQELNLSNYASDRIKKMIIKYSKQANKVIQSNASASEKSKDLSNIVYFQNEDFKKVLTVHQFYKYLKLKNI